MKTSQVPIKQFSFKCLLLPSLFHDGFRFRLNYINSINFVNQVRASHTVLSFLKSSLCGLLYVCMCMCVHRGGYMEFKEVKLIQCWSLHCCCVNPCITSHFGNNGNSHNASNRQRGSMVDSSVQLSIIRSKCYWKVVVKWCTWYLG